MGQRGPKPNVNAARPRSRARNRNMTAAVAVPPNLIGAYRAETAVWWDAWLTSPQAAFFAATDWQTLAASRPSR